MTKLFIEVMVPYFSGRGGAQHATPCVKRATPPIKKSIVSSGSNVH